MYQLRQYEKNKIYLHGISDSVSSLIELYYKFSQHLGYMEIVDTTDNYRVLATLGSKGVNHFSNK